jgi:hypothetical protein
MPRYSKAKIRALIQQSDNAATADEKGEKLEQLVCYLFEKIPGLHFHDKNILDTNRAHELDIAFWNSQNVSEVFFLDPIVIVECKNTTDPVGSAEVGWFVRKLQDRGANYGVLVALSGITGTGDGVTAAHSEVLTALTRDRIKIVLITRDEILSLASSDDLVHLMKGKILRLTLYKAVA